MGKGFHMFKISKSTRSLIRLALREDLGRGDVTTETLIPHRLKGEARIVANDLGVLCGGAVVKEVFRLIDPHLSVVQNVRDGDRISSGKAVFVLRGRLASILKGERVALNFLGRLSGIAMLTNQFVRKVKGTRAKIYDTRKTTPLWRELEKYAVRQGGGGNHRFGLWDEILVKNNHWNAIRPLLIETQCQYFGDRLRPVLGRNRLPVEVEVRTMSEFTHSLEGRFHPDRILLDHFNTRELKQAVRLTRHFQPRPLLEASGGVSLSSVRAIARTGVDRISVGAITQSASSLDFSLKVLPP
ncbi:MAG: nicotinate-nucleotide diphosphorylase (carboxylating) [Omnitrophica bacterium RIFCSPLOWO2_12_FULL_50_11]|nr:MAG: nicotinate-nucleotide diphosphorylase (carboxylating) [Omnitrophica bacterium RIFCSPLOWO2_12_FULL_50_11]